MTASNVVFIGTKAVNGESITTYVGGSVALNTDNVLEGSNSVGDKVSATTVTTYALGAAVTGEPYNFSSGGANELDHIFMITQLQGSVDTLAAGGVGIVVADDLATDSVGTWYVGPKPGYLGGWVYYVVDPARAFNTVTAGSASWTTNGNPAQLSGVDGFGVRWKITNSIMGSSDNCFLDVVSVGTGYRITLGDAGSTEGKFSDITTFEETSTNRYGALESKSGVLFPLSRIYIGAASGSTNTEFYDSNFTVVWQDAYVRSTFYALICEQGTGTTDVQLSNGILKAAGSTEVYLDFAGVSNVDLTNINVERARLIDLDANCNWTGGQIASSGQIELFGAAVMDNLKILSGTDASQLKITNNTYLDNVSNLSFTSAGTGHAIEITAIGSSYVFDNINFSNYAASDGSTGNEALYNNSGGAITVSISGGTIPSVRNGPGATTTLVLGAVDLSINVKDITNSANIPNARVLVLAAAGGDLPSNDPVSITLDYLTATVTHSGHNLSTGNKVLIKGVNDTVYNGIHTISGINANQYSFLLDEGMTVSGLTGRYDSDSGSNTLSGDHMSTLADLSGNGRHFSQSTDSLRPIVKYDSQKDRNVITFSGYDDGAQYMYQSTGIENMISTTSWTVVMEAKLKTPDSDSEFWPGAVGPSVPGQAPNLLGSNMQTFGGILSHTIDGTINAGGGYWDDGYDTPYFTYDKPMFVDSWATIQVRKGASNFIASIGMHNGSGTVLTDPIRQTETGEVLNLGRNDPAYGAYTYCPCQIGRFAVYNVELTEKQTQLVANALSASTPATGSPTATAVIIDGLTDSNGDISTTRSYSSDQPITGKVRRATTGTRYKTSSFAGTINNLTGLSLSIQLIRDE